MCMYVCVSVYMYAMCVEVLTVAAENCQIPWMGIGDWTQVL